MNSKRNIYCPKMRTKSISRHADIYCKSSSIHGLQYLTTGEEISWFDHIIWAVALTVSLCICILLLLALNEDWDNNPVVTSIDSTSYPIQNISLPGVTICPSGYDIMAFVQRKVVLNIKFNKHFVTHISTLKFLS
jgi:hypothetical protein